LHLFAHRAAGCDGATIVCTRARIAFRHLLTVFSPLATIVDLHMIHISENNVRLNLLHGSANAVN
jgi:hypothetical protein